MNPSNELGLFQACVQAALGNKDLITEYDRLNGTNLSRKGSPIEQMIDSSTGRHDTELNEFFSFVRETIYQPLMQP